MVDLESFHAKRAAIIFNPVARRLSRSRHLLQRTTEILENQGIHATLVGTTAPGTAGALARRQIEAGCDLILAAGGDGTINEIASGMLHSNVPLAILPGGTANVLAREIRLPMRMDAVAARLLSLKPQRLAVGRLRLKDSAPRPFLCMAGAGLDASIVNHLNLDLKVMAGKLAYYAAGFAHVFRPLPEFEVLVNDQRYEASFALISRVRNYGGDLEIARGASLLRNEFEIVLFRGRQSYQYLPYLLGVAAGQIQRLSGVTILRGRSVACRQPKDPSQVFVQVDGELAGTLSMSADIVPDALTLLVPPQFVAREQSLIAEPVCA
jgi:diacylglycerol kinase family enzyme